MVENDTYFEEYIPMIQIPRIKDEPPRLVFNDTKANIGPQSPFQRWEEVLRKFCMK
jgi:hypothetical protein